MQITLPQSKGWSGAALMDDTWGRVGAVAKCCFAWSGAAAVRAAATPIRQADEMDAATGILAAEAEMALFKKNADWHFRGLGVGVQGSSSAVTAAELSNAGAVRVKFARPPAPGPYDTVNLFGFEPRANRKAGMALPVPPPPAPFDIAGYGKFMFEATRSHDGYAPVNQSSELPADLDIVVTTHVGATATTVLSARLQLPTVLLRGWLYEGGPDKDAYWCAKASVRLVADTLILSATGAEVLWRAGFAFADAPKKILRRLSIEEAA